MKTNLVLLSILISAGLLTGASAFARGGPGGGTGNTTTCPVPPAG